MKFQATLALAAAPLALAKAVHNVYPVRRDASLPKNTVKRSSDVLQAAGLSGLGITSGAVGEVILIWVNPGAGAATTTINQQVTVTQTVTVGGGGGGGAAAPEATTPPAESAPPAAGAPGAVPTHSVTVGGPAGLQFVPNEVKAAIGDMVIFTFQSQNHTATQSAFDTPCDPLAGGMDSGFQPNPNNSVNPAPQVAMQVMVDTPLWFYCAQQGHCGKGMTFSINPTAEKTQAMFQSMAIAQKGTGTGSAITGGGGAAAAPAGGAAAGGAAAGGAAAPAESSTSLLPLGGAASTGSAAAPGATGNIVSGSGQINPDGSCTCAVTCGAGAFPNVAAQGIGMIGGMAGALPANMVETV